MIYKRRMTAVVIWAVALVIWALSALPTSQAPTAAAQTAPSPRPALTPTPGSKRESQPETLYGHVTGTVIDLTTGAPTAGLTVRIGEFQVSTDANGNYDRWVAEGTHMVELLLGAELGAVAQQPVTVNVTANQRVVVHLAFRSPLRATATPVATTVVAPPATPVPVTDVTGLAPVVTTEPVSNEVVAAPAVVPSRLPVTGFPIEHDWLWLSFGLVLLVIGGFLLSRPGRSGRPIAVEGAELLMQLLANPPQKRVVQESEDLLEELLKHKPTRK